MKRFIVLLGLLLLFVSSAQADMVFDGRNFGTPGLECSHSCNALQVPSLSPWSYFQSDKARNTGNFYRVVSSPARVAGRETAELHLVPIPVGSTERMQFRASQIGLPGVTGKDFVFAGSYYFRPGVVYPQWISMLDVGTKFNTNCAGSASHGGGNGAGVPELYFHNSSAIPSDPVTGKLKGLPASSPTWSLIVKLAGGSGPQYQKPPSSWKPYNCNFRYYTLLNGPIPTGVSIDVLWHFHYSAVNGQAVTEFYYRIAPATAWTQADLDPKTASFADTKPNLVRTTQYDAAIDMHVGDYAENEDVVQFDTGLDLEGVVVTTTREEAEKAAFEAP